MPVNTTVKKQPKSKPKAKELKEQRGKPKKRNWKTEKEKEESTTATEPESNDSDDKAAKAAERERRKGLSKFLKQFGSKTVKNPNKDSTYDRIKVRSLQKTEEGNKVLDKLYEQWLKNEQGPEDEPEEEAEQPPDEKDEEEKPVEEPKVKPSELKIPKRLVKAVSKLDDEQFATLAKQAAQAAFDEKDRNGNVPPDSRKLGVRLLRKYPAIPKQIKTYGDLRDLVSDLPALQKKSSEVPSDLSDKAGESVIQAAEELKQLSADDAKKLANGIHENLAELHEAHVNGSAENVDKNLSAIKDSLGEVLGKESMSALSDAIDEAALPLTEHLEKLAEEAKELDDAEGEDEPEADEEGSEEAKDENDSVDDTVDDTTETDEPDPADKSNTQEVDTNDEESEEAPTTKSVEDPGSKQEQAPAKNDTKEPQQDEVDDEPEQVQRKPGRKVVYEDADDESHPMDPLGSLFFFLFKLIGAPIAAVTRALARTINYYTSYDYESRHTKSDNGTDAELSTRPDPGAVKDATKKSAFVLSDAKIASMLEEVGAYNTAECTPCVRLQKVANAASRFKTAGNITAYRKTLGNLVEAMLQNLGDDKLTDIKFTASDLSSIEGPEELSSLYSECMVRKGNRNYCARLAAESFLAAFPDHPFADALSLKVASSTQLASEDLTSWLGDGDELYMWQPPGDLHYGPVQKVDPDYAVFGGAVYSKFELNDLVRRNLLSTSLDKLRSAESPTLTIASNGTKWCVVSKKSNRRLGSFYSNRLSAERHLRELEFSKHEKAKLDNLAIVHALAEYGSDRHSSYLNKLRTAEAKMNETNDSMLIWIPLSESCESIVKALQSKASTLCQEQDIEIVNESGEPEPHVTLLYVGSASKQSDIHKIRELLENIVSSVTPGHLKSDGVSYFDTDKSVCKLGIKASSWLDNLHWRIRTEMDEAGLKYDHSFPEYKPHVTLHYLAKGSKIEGLDFNNFSWVPTHVNFSHGFGTDRIGFNPVENVQSITVTSDKVLASTWMDDDSAETLIETAESIGIGTKKRNKRSVWNKFAKGVAKKWTCCSKPEKSLDRNHKTIWVSNCKYRGSMGNRVMKRIVARGPKSPKFVTLNDKKVPWCQGRA